MMDLFCYVSSPFLRERIKVRVTLLLLKRGGEGGMKIIDHITYSSPIPSPQRGEGVKRRA
jgi:hypothetical protein